MNEDVKQIELKNLIADTLNYIKKLGADHAECSIVEHKGFSVDVRVSEVEAVKYSHDKIFTITAYCGKHTATSTAKNTTLSSLRLAAEKAFSLAQFTEDDPYSGLADKELLAFDYPDLDLYHPWNISVDEAIAKAKECEAIAFAADKHIVNSDGCAIETLDTHYAYGNTNDFIGGIRSTVHNIHCALIAQQNNSMQRDYDFSIASDSNDLEDINKIAKSAAKRTVERLGAKTLTTRQCPVIFNSDTAKTLLKMLIKAISGKNLYRNSSFLLNHINKQIFPKFINIDERPCLLKRFCSSPFDAEGVATKEKYFIKDGVLENYALGSYSARKLKMQSTGNSGGIYNLFLNSGKLNLAGLLKEMHQGLLVAELFGNEANIVTGDFSYGAFGFWVENGEIQYPVEEITIAGNLKDLFHNIIATGNDIDYRNNIVTGSILADTLTVAGK